MRWKAKDGSREGAPLLRVERLDDIRPLDAITALRRCRLPFIARYGGRYTYASADPFVTISSYKEASGIKTRIEGQKYPVAITAEDPFMALSRLFSGIEKKCEKPPFPFSGGLFGYFSYDLKEHLPNRPRKSFDNPLRDKAALPIPLALAGVYDPIYVFDAEAGAGFVVSTGQNPDEKAFDSFIGLIRGAKKNACVFLPRSNDARPDMTKQEFVSMVEKAKAYITEGDIYQINLSLRLSMKFGGDPLSLFAFLARSRPSNYSAFMDAGDFQIIANSPERFLRSSGRKVFTEPIKGTRARGGTLADDEAQKSALKASKKEMAEHVMIVDLERNDLGRVCAPGSVRVDRFASIETYPALHHMTSVVEGELSPGVDVFTCLREVFPGGSVTGAPKIRAMEIIDELETSKRALYTGAMGFVGFDDEADLFMTIRTAICKDRALWLGVGSGIVADSVPELEYDEAILKASDFIEALKGSPA